MRGPEEEGPKWVPSPISPYSEPPTYIRSALMPTSSKLGEVSVARVHFFLAALPGNPEKQGDTHRDKKERRSFAPASLPTMAKLPQIYNTYFIACIATLGGML